MGKSTQFSRGLYTHYKDSLLKGGMSLSPIQRLLTMAHVETKNKQQNKEGEMCVFFLGWCKNVVVGVCFLFFIVEDTCFLVYMVR